jgi:hypothetical protein
MTGDEVIAYNLRDGGNAFSVFAETQPGRVTRARKHIRAILDRPDVDYEGPLIIMELGCGAGDISGPFSNDHIVTGFDVTPGAVRAARERFPRMTVIESKVEDQIPLLCDILVLTEFLEHVPEPMKIVKDWFPLAKYVVVGHPLNDPGGNEPGHLWSYDLDDFRMWFKYGGHLLLTWEEFSEGSFPQMVLGHGIRGRWPEDEL